MPTTNQPDRKGLRSFGLTMGLAIAALFGALVPWVLQSTVPVWPWALGLILTAWALAAPGSLAPVHAGWMWLAERLGRFNGYLILAIVFILILTPTGLILRLAGRDLMRRRYDAAAATYSTPATDTTPQQMERPF